MCDLLACGEELSMEIRRRMPRLMKGFWGIFFMVSCLRLAQSIVPVFYRKTARLP